MMRILSVVLYVYWLGEALRRPSVASRPRGVASMSSISVQAAAGSHSKFISFRSEKLRIHYEEHRSSDPNAPVILLVPGFGVGTFHYEHQFAALSDAFNVYSLDLLGQGQSWPEGPVEPEDRLCYSADLWGDQVLDFIEKVIKRPVHICGNSLGGYLSVLAASRRPDLVSSVTLLNAAPFWGFMPSKGSPELCWPLNSIWNGTLPAPAALLTFGGAYFDVMRRPSTINAMLAGVYATRSAFDDELVDNIVASANRPGGYEAFTSILFAPKCAQTFDSMLADLRRAGKPVSLVYGRDDPWIVPYWGQRAKRRLDGMGTYFELEGAGHCPHHEAPAAVNAILRAWVGVVESGAAARGQLSLDSRLLELAGEYAEARTGAAVRVKLVEGQPRSLWERFLFWLDGLRAEEED